MMTVMRFGFPESMISERILEFGRGLAKVRPDVLESFSDIRRGGVNVSLFDGADRAEHLRVIVRALKDWEASLKEAEALGIGVSIDVGVEAEDVVCIPYSIRLPLDVLEALSRGGVDFEITLYFDGNG
jgi:hypothetical protein